MRENRTYGSEGGEAKSLPYPLSTVIVDGACTISAVVIPSAASCTLGFTLQTAICSQPRLRDLAARCARALRRFATLDKNKRAQGKPGARCTRGLACNSVQKTHTS